MHFNANIASLVILFCSAMTANASPFPQNGAAALVNGGGIVKTSRPVNAAGAAAGPTSRPVNTNGAATVPTSRPINPDGSAATPIPRPVNADGSAAYVPYSILKHSIINQISNSRRGFVEVIVDQAPPVNGDGQAKTSRPVNADGSAATKTARPVNGDGSAAVPTARPINPDGSAAYVIKLTIFKSSLTPHSRNIIAFLKARFAQAPPINGDGAAKTLRPVNADGSAVTKTARPVNPDGSAATPTPRPVNAGGAAI
jgi:hypothetical protein